MQGKRQSPRSEFQMTNDDGDLLLDAIAIVTLVGKWKVYTEDDSDTNYEVL